MRKSVAAAIVTGVVPFLVFAVHSAFAAGISDYVLQAPEDEAASATNLQRPIGIVIMAQGRSGSTMLGETFRQNKDVLYWYEPCRSWGQGIFDSSSRYHREIHGEECSGLVRRLARCEFTIEDSARLGVDPAALDSGSSELGPLRAASVHPSAGVLAEAHEAVVRVCRQSRAVVVKTIRADAGVGGPDGDASGLLVVHLVRDPRAVINSQVKTFNVAHKYRRYFNNNNAPPETNPDNRNATVAGKPSEADANAGAAGVGSGLTSLPWGGQERARTLGLIVCGVYKDQLDSSAKLDDSRYLRVRYEDIASSAELTVEHVYRWSGLGTVPSRVSLWINENTRLPDCGDSQVTAAAATTIAAPEGGQESHRAVTEEIANGSASSARDTNPTTAVPGSGGDPMAAGLGRAVDDAVQGVEEPGTEQGAAELGRAVEAAAAPTSRRLSGEKHVNCREKMAKQVEWDRYGTRRHAAAMIDLWRKQMPKDEAEAVWEGCTESGVMHVMGYSP